LEQAYNPMTVRFFILQAHYRSTLDFSNEALQAAEKGLKRLMQAAKTVESISPANVNDNEDIKNIEKECYEALNDDLNTPIAISALFEVARTVNSVADKKEKINVGDIERLKKLFKNVAVDILGLKEEQNNNQNELLNNLVKMIIDIRQQSKDKKDWATSDKIRDELVKLGIVIKDTKEGTDWEI
jgi:cysteinyl-tRNA synthetase